MLDNFDPSASYPPSAMPPESGILHRRNRLPARKHMALPQARIARKALDVAIDVIIDGDRGDVVEAGGDVVGDRVRQRRRKARRFMMPICTGASAGKPSASVSTFMPGRRADSGRTETAMPASTAAATTVDDQLVNRIWYSLPVASSAAQAACRHWQSRRPTASGIGAFSGSGWLIELTQQSGSVRTTSDARARGLCVTRAMSRSPLAIFSARSTDGSQMM